MIMQNIMYQHVIFINAVRVNGERVAYHISYSSELNPTQKKHMEILNKMTVDRETDYTIHKIDVEEPTITALKQHEPYFDDIVFIPFEDFIKIHPGPMPWLKKSN